MADLNERQQRFVAEYLVDLDPAQAAIRAGYSVRNARNQGQVNLSHPGIIQAIAAAQAERAERVDVSADRVIEELARIAFADIRRLFAWDAERAAYVPSGDLTAAEAAAIAEVQAKTTRTTREDGTAETRIELKLKTYDKLGALEKLGKHLGLFTDYIQLTVVDRLRRLPPEDLARLETMSDEEIRRELPKLLSK